MQDKVIKVLNSTCYETLIDEEDWATLFEVMHEESLLSNRYVQEIVTILQDGLDINLKREQEQAFVAKMKAMLAAGYPLNRSYINVYNGIRLRSWLTSREWTNLYGMSLDDAINALIEAGYNIEETPDMGTLMWIE